MNKYPLISRHSKVITMQTYWLFSYQFLLIISSYFTTAFTLVATEKRRLMDAQRDISIGYNHCVDEIAKIRYDHPYNKDTDKLVYNVEKGTICKTPNAAHASKCMKVFLETVDDCNINKEGELLGGNLSP